MKILTFAAFFRLHSVAFCFAQHLPSAAEQRRTQLLACCRAAHDRRRHQHRNNSSLPAQVLQFGQRLLLSPRRTDVVFPCRGTVLPAACSAIRPLRPLCTASFLKLPYHRICLKVLRLPTVILGWALTRVELNAVMEICTGTSLLRNVCRTSAPSFSTVSRHMKY